MSTVLQAASGAHFNYRPGWRCPWYFLLGRFTKCPRPKGSHFPMVCIRPSHVLSKTWHPSNRPLMGQEPLRNVVEVRAQTYIFQIWKLTITSWDLYWDISLYGNHMIMASWSTWQLHDYSYI